MMADPRIRPDMPMRLIPLPKILLKNPFAPSSTLIPRPIDKVGMSIGTVNKTTNNFLNLIFEKFKKYAAIKLSTTDSTDPANEYKSEFFKAR